MAETKTDAKPKAEINYDRLEDVALGILSTAMATGVHGKHIRAAVDRAFEGASIFLKVANEIRDGRPIVSTVRTGAPFADCFAPNLPARHPLNIVAQAHVHKSGAKCGGDIELVNRIWNRIKDVDESKFEDKATLDDPDLAINWEKDTITIAKKVLQPLVAYSAATSVN
jgi:hypothetical protein